MTTDALLLARLREALRACLTDTPDSLDEPRRRIMLRRLIEDCDRVLETRTVTETAA